ncbi:MULTISPECIES: hypothetical protein [Mycobacteriaceae]|uniref:hypothetical protein n=1 Tax=Mycobacteriaceae TaxID=1762 RepID=UPI000A97CFCA|nr:MULTISPECIES: hypothetical protein [Mycobacteriaceae]
MTNLPPPGWDPLQPSSQHQDDPPKPQYGHGQLQQVSWAPPPPPPKNSIKWLLIGIAVLLVVAISVGATLLFTRSGDTTQATSSTPSESDVASANDTGPVSVITEDPTCEPSRPIISSLSQRQKMGWTERDITIPASEWTDSQRSVYQDVADAMRRAADQTVELAKATPHRAMRELYLQAIAFWRAYADSLPTYTERDNALAVVTTDLAGAIVSICAAIDYGSAAARVPFVSTPSPPDVEHRPIDVNSPSIFIGDTGNAVCKDWKDVSRKFDSDVTQWQAIDPNLTAGQWTAEQRRVMDQSADIMRKYAVDLLALGKRSGNPTLFDLSSLSSVYWDAFAASIDSYNSADSYLSSVANYANFAIYYACEYAES